MNWDVVSKNLNDQKCCEQNYNSQKPFTSQHTHKKEAREERKQKKHQQNVLNRTELVV